MPIKAADMSSYKPILGQHPLPPVWVMGAGNDAMIMPHQVHDAADFFSTEAVLVPDVAHDVMLVSHLSNEPGAPEPGTPFL